MSLVAASTSIMAAASPPLSTASPTLTCSTGKMSMSRASMPSYRPHTSVSVSSRASSRASDCVSGLPAAASMMIRPAPPRSVSSSRKVFTSGSSIMTMPGPPP